MYIYVKVLSKFNVRWIGSKYIWKIDSLVINLGSFFDHIMKYSVEFTLLLTFADERNE